MTRNLRLLTVLFFIFSFSFFIRAQSWSWAREANGVTTDASACVNADRYGNAFMSGAFYDNIGFASYNLSTLSGYDTYLVKYDSAGKVCWATQPVAAGKYSSTAGGCSAADAAGNVYLAGDFNDSLQFGSYLLPGLDQMFLVRYNSNGVVKWAKQTNDTGNGYVEVEVCNIATDNRGNAIITGILSAGMILFGNDSLSTNGGSFLVKYDSNGNALWAKAPVAYTTKFQGASISTDDSGNIFWAGYFEGTVEFGTTILTNTAGVDIFLAKYAPDGTFLWARQGINGIIYGAISSTTDRAGCTYVTGRFSDSIRFGNTDLYSTINGKIFLVKYDEDGNMVWAKTNGGGVWGGFSLSSDAQNHIYLTCSQWTDSLPDTFQFGGYSYVAPVFNWDSSSRVILQCDTSGNVLASFHFFSASGCCCYGENIAASHFSNFVYVAGFMGCTTIFGPDTMFGGGSTPYIARWEPDAISEGIMSAMVNCTQLTVYPNPSNGNFTFRSSLISGKSSVEVYNVLGDKVYSQFLIPNSSFSIDFSSQPSGIYLYRVLKNDGSVLGEGKLIIQK